MEERILLSLCDMGGTEQKWIDSQMESGWVVPLGPAVDEFERRLGAFLDAPAVTALSSGTAALHLGLILAGVKAGETVICQDFTFAASANPICYIGAKPAFVDSESDTWNMSPEALVHAIETLDKEGRHPAAIVVTDLYGMPAKLDEIASIAREHGIPVVEDSAEALGSEYKGKHCGTFGMFGVLSFNGNKIITTSGGGAIICPDKEWARKALFLATQAREDRPYYYHKTIGFNYRLSNICAAIGCGQMEVLESHLSRRRSIHRLYSKLLADIPGIKLHSNPTEDFNSNYWLSTITIEPETGVTPEQARQHLQSHNIETRRLWRPMSMQPVFADAPVFLTGVGRQLFDSGLCLPSGSGLSDSDIERVASTLRELFK